jgi:hypothetical protein
MFKNTDCNFNAHTSTSLSKEYAFKLMFMKFIFLWTKTQTPPFLKDFLEYSAQM